MSPILLVFVFAEQVRQYNIVPKKKKKYVNSTLWQRHYSFPGAMLTGL